MQALQASGIEWRYFSMKRCLIKKTCTIENSACLTCPRITQLMLRSRASFYAERRRILADMKIRSTAASGE
jgi:hypothetical protein